MIRRSDILLVSVWSALVLLVATIGEVQSPTEYDMRGTPAGREFCAWVGEWKGILRRDHPDNIEARSVPLVERRCHMPRETLG